MILIFLLVAEKKNFGRIPKKPSNRGACGALCVLWEGSGERWGVGGGRGGALAGGSQGERDFFCSII